ncbi:MAG: hypothetical protein GC154_19555 [bacterium]|nr:hypothetical protein [bacterium]
MMKNPLLQRSIRGNNSLLGRLNLRLESCESLIQRLQQSGVLDAVTMFESYNELSDIASVAENCVQPLIDLEQQILEKKEAIPGYDELSDAQDRIRFHRDRGEHDIADTLESEWGERIESFQTIRAEIDALLHQARLFRFDFLRQQSRLTVLEYKLLTRLVASDARRLLERIQSGDNGEWSEYKALLQTWSEPPDVQPRTIHPSDSIERKIALLENEIISIEDDIKNRLMKNKAVIDRIKNLILQRA